ncbi:hypothetical protein Hanom_Chr08g00687801 [Helianthus anomalus]
MWFLYDIFDSSFLFLCVCMSFVLELGVSLEAASLSTRIEVRVAYIPPSSDPTNSFCCVLGFIGYGW